MECQKAHFSIPEAIAYLNCAYKAPQMKKLEQAGIAIIQRQNHPFSYAISDFFEPVNHLKKAFARLITASEYERIALIPSVSYGLANVANNVKLDKGDKVLIADEQFPSNVYPWMKLVEKQKATLDIIAPPTTSKNRGAEWNQAILEAIDDGTKLVALGHVHWADGTLFDLKAIREKTRKYGALMVIDGTQSVGALPFSVQDLQPDALICGGYKWLMGPYSLGLAYYGPYFDNGEPIEENWMNRLNSENFKGLVNYQPQYRPLANRYSVGEQSNFILVPLLLAAIEQLNDWGVVNIQQYCQKITDKAIEELSNMGLTIENESYRTCHLFGVKLTEYFDEVRLQQELEKANIIVSFRGKSMRVAPHVYNEAADLTKLVDCFKKARKRVMV